VIRWALLLVLLMPAPAHALLSACSLFTITGVSFGAYSPTSSTDLDGSGTFSFDCVAVLGGGSLTISLSTGGSGTYAPRQKIGRAHV
jgi:spore coat protein U-like protein